jgi:probable phosphoglycerate mutase
MLIGHGQTPCNVSGELDTAYPGAGLTNVGLAQAVAVPAALVDERIAGIYATSLLRTQLTAAPLAEARRVEVQICDGLEEISAGDYEMRGDGHAVQEYAECLATWMRGQLDYALPGGHSGNAFISRYDDAIRGIVSNHDPAGSVVIFSHGAAIRVYTAVRAGLDPAVATELRIANTGLAMLDGDPDAGWALQRWTTAWVRTLFLGLAADADAEDPKPLAESLVVLYDGAVATAQMDKAPQAAQTARQLADLVLDAAGTRARRRRRRRG